MEANKQNDFTPFGNVVVQAGATINQTYVAGDYISGDVINGNKIVKGEEAVITTNEEKQLEQNPLLRFILDENERETVAAGLKQCYDTKQLALFAKSIYNDNVLTYEVIRSAEFHRAILSMLNFETTERAIKEAIYKQVRV